MPIRFQCRDCGVTINAPDDRRGQQARCPKCRRIVMVPEAPAPASQETGKASPLPDWIDAPPAVQRPAPDPPVTHVPTIVPSSPVAVPPAETVPCPMCAEPISPAARKCKHCGEMLDPDLRPSMPQQMAVPTINIVNNATASAAAAVIVDRRPEGCLGFGVGSCLGMVALGVLFGLFLTCMGSIAAGRRTSHMAVPAGRQNERR